MPAAGADAAAAHPPRFGWTVPVLVTLATMLCGAAWALSLPPYRGIDEISHSYRAASILEGHWVAVQPAQGTAGPGGLVWVPRGMVDAAREQCIAKRGGHRERLGQCFPIEVRGDKALTATTAGHYIPTLYVPAGLLISRLDGVTALWVLRALVVLLSAFFFGLAAWCIQQWRRSSWPILGFFVALSPMVGYSLAVFSPNPVEFAAATALWAALIGVWRSDDRSIQRRLLWAAIPAGMVESNLRQLGPAFVLFTIGVAAMLMGRPKVFSLVRQCRAPLVAGLLLVGTAAALNSVWVSMVQGVPGEDHGNAPGEDWTAAGALTRLAYYAWQLIGAFPTRFDTAPAGVYALYGTAVLAWVFIGARVVERRARAAIVGVLLTGTVLLPLVFDRLTYESLGFVWQGRYALPLLVGVPLLVAAGIDQKVRSNPPRVLALLVVGGLFVAHSWAGLDMLATIRTHDHGVPDPGWWIPPMWLVATVHATAWGLGLRAVTSPTDPQRPDRAPEPLAAAPA